MAVEATEPRTAEFELGVRGYLIDRFHRSVYDRIENDDVQILRVQGQRRQPDAWRRP